MGASCVERIPRGGEDYIAVRGAEKEKGYAWVEGGVGGDVFGYGAGGKAAA